MTGGRLFADIDDARSLHKRVMSVAAVQRHLQVSARGELIEVPSYLSSKLCATLAQSMIGDGGHVTLEVKAAEGSVFSSRRC